MNLSKILRDPRIAYPILLLAVAYPIVSPIGIPLYIGTDVIDVIDVIDSLPKGSVVVMANDIGYRNYAEHGPGIEVIFRYFMERDLKVIMLSFHTMPEAALLTDTILRDVLIPEDKIYGIDYVNLGWLTGEEGAIASFAKDIHNIAISDYSGTPVKDIPIMTNVKDISDISLWVSFSTLAGEFPERYLRQLESNYGTDIICFSSSSLAPAIMPYVVSGQIIGFLGGIRAAAEMEVSTRLVGKAASTMDSQSLAHIWILAVIIAANINDIVKRLGGNKL